MKVSFLYTQSGCETIKGAIRAINLLLLWPFVIFFCITLNEFEGDAKKMPKLLAAS